MIRNEPIEEKAEDFEEIDAPEDELPKGFEINEE